MRESRKGLFLRCYKSDGTIDSICRRCKANIATVEDLADLELPEQFHECDQHPENQGSGNHSA